MLFKVSGLSLVFVYLFNSHAFAGKTIIINIPTKDIQNPILEYPNKPPRMSADGRYVLFSILSDMKGVKTSQVLDKRIISKLLPSIEKLSVFVYDSQTGKTETINTS